MWRERAGTVFECEKTLVTASRGMSLQEAVEAPRVFTQGQEPEIENGFAGEVHSAMASLGHPVVAVDRVAGGMCAIAFAPDGAMTGAACWRADGTPLGLGGGLARKNTHFFTDPRGIAARAAAAKA